MHQNGEQQIVIVDDTVALIARAEIHPAEQSCNSNVNSNSQMCQRLVAFRLYDASFQQDFQLV